MSWGMMMDASGAFVWEPDKFDAYEALHTPLQGF
jgi:hypothetical protein